MSSNRTEFNSHSEEFQRPVGELILLSRMVQPDEISDALITAIT